MNLIYHLLSCLCLVFIARADECSTVGAVDLAWTISRVNTTAEQYLTINGKWPADKLVYARCTLLQLKVTNNLPDDSISLHFHGLLQDNGQAMMDGVVGLTQSGIAPQKTFTYRVLLDKPGTYWIHSHSPGQYPQGLRAPLIILPEGVTSPNFTDDVVTLSDWWPNFKAAETKSLDTSSGTCGTPGTSPETRNVGIELPPSRVTFNDVFGYNKGATTVEAKRIARTIKVTCGTSRRIRIINMSAFARFYVAFSDGRDFTVTELDGIDYAGTPTAWLELASGQRASIVVDGYSSIQKGCFGAYIIAFSDTKVNAGTSSCPMTPTNSSYSLQYAHGYLQVGSTVLPDHADLRPDIDFPGDWARMWTEAGALQYRPKIPFKSMWSNPSQKLDYSLSKQGARTVQSIMAVDRADELTMKPTTAIPMWTVVNDTTRTGHMHYISLDHLFSQTSPEKNGYAAMTEYLKVNPYTEWKSPAGEDKPSPGRTQNDLPSLYRVLRDSFDNAKISSAETYYSDSTSQKGKTIMINDQQPHWFIIRSKRGDHPMHMHGHHFQVLAKLPTEWWDSESIQLYNHIGDKSIRSDGKANLDNPPRRDTLFIDKGFTYVIAMLPDNPGVWAFHCHNDIHAVSGMFSQIIERPVDFRASLGSWDYYTTMGVTEMRWWTSSGADRFWRTKDVAGNWMVDNLKAAIQRYGWEDQYTAVNSKNPSKWAIAKRWIPRGGRWY